jgi:hypothetical protein
MGLKGMSLHGGMLNFCNEEGIIQQHYLDLVYAQSSNQSLEEAMSGIAAMLDFIQELYPDIETIWIVSDKCSNFNSFEQKPFVVESNARQWVLPATGNRMAKHNKKRKGMQVEKWMCTEAQLGKDQLDCHFAWITECFKAYLNKEGNNLIISLYMFTALTDPSFDIANTHVMYGSTAHPKLQKKFVMKHLKVHQVHEY